MIIESLRDKRYVLFVLALSLLAVFRAGAHQETSVRVELDRKEVRIGQVLKLLAEVTLPEDAELVMGDEPERLGVFEVLSRDTARVRTRRAETIYRVRYELDPYLPGEHIIPPIEFNWVSAGIEKTFFSEELAVTVISLVGPEATDIRPAKGLVLPRRPWGVILSLLAAFMAALIIFLIKRGKASSAGDVGPVPADEIAYAELIRLRAARLPEKGLSREYYYRLSDIVRHYLEARFSLRAPEMTTEEFLNELKLSEALSSKHKGLLKDFLEKCDLVKFARYGPKPIEVVDSYNAAVRLVDETRFEKDEEQL